MQTRIIIVHGWEGSPEGIWIPWLKQELESQGHTVLTPAMPNPAHPELKEWLLELQSTLGTPDEQTFLIGHSLGCITILRYLESLAPEMKVGGAILIAGFTTDLGYKELKSFAETPLNWSAITSHGAKFTAIHSDNDSYVSLHYGDIFKEKLNAELIIEHNAFHFSGKTKELQIAKKSIEKMII